VEERDESAWTSAAAAVEGRRRVGMHLESDGVGGDGDGSWWTSAAAAVEGQRRVTVVLGGAGGGGTATGRRGARRRRRWRDGDGSPWSSGATNK
jgi:hypothetical protein